MGTILSKLSFGKTLLTVLTAALMFRASAWQWDRYHQKTALVAAYKENSAAPSVELPTAELSAAGEPLRPGETERLAELRYRKVRLRGRFDHARELIITNRVSAKGPGHHLFAPFLLESDSPGGETRAVLVSRGFIPFEDRTVESWKKYALPDEVREIEAVVQESVDSLSIGPKNPEVVPGGELPRIWFFEEVPKIASALPYPLLGKLYLQELHPAGAAGYPLEAISIRVPPSTHFGYTIEWALLGTLTLLLGIGLQLFPIRRRVVMRSQNGYGRHVENGPTESTTLPNRSRKI